MGNILSQSQNTDQQGNAASAAKKEPCFEFTSFILSSLKVENSEIKMQVQLGTEEGTNEYILGFPILSAVEPQNLEVYKRLVTPEKGK